MKRANMANTQRGVMLLEALIAILIFSLGILALIGLQAAAIKNTVDSKFRADASFLTNQVIGQMWVDRLNLADYTDATNAKRIAWEGLIDATLPNASGAVELNGSTVKVTVQWQAPGQTQNHKYVAVDNIN
jgi:type IV pilus assembly protein PilV